MCAKANKMLGFLRQNLKVGSWKVKERAHKAMIRPIPEYASSVLDPHTKKSISKMELVQCRAARFTLNQYHNTYSVEEKLEMREWPTLQQRRHAARLTMLYKITNGLACVKSLDLTPQRFSEAKRPQPEMRTDTMPD